MLKTILIPGQFFLMGSEDGQLDERPVHRVWIDAFEIGVTQVTNSEYASFANATGRSLPSTPFIDPEQPVVAVSWFDAVAYCDWLSETSGRRVRLPCEAEWECAARGGAEGTRYPSGNELPLQDDERFANGPEPVGRRVPNAYGIYDICENVHEWCSDWYAPDYYAVSPERNPRGPENGKRRVSRGGSWRHRIKFSRCAARSSIPPEFQYADYGFRIACDARG
jgi:formylglycine-generating enzyme required for sulfatase activity